MLVAACYILWAALTLGVVLGFFHLRGRRLPHWMIGAVHGSVGALGLGILAFALKSGAVRGAQFGAESFGKFAAILAAIALVAGIVFVLLPKASRRRTYWLLGAHATLGAAACIFLLAYVSLG
jgi:hypothetical protein